MSPLKKISSRPSLKWPDYESIPVSQFNETLLYSTYLSISMTHFLLLKSAKFNLTDSKNTKLAPFNIDLSSICSVLHNLTIKYVNKKQTIQAAKLWNIAKKNNKVNSSPGVLLLAISYTRHSLPILLGIACIKACLQTVFEHMVRNGKCQWNRHKKLRV